MKKLALFSLIAVSALSLASCDKAEKLLLQPFESPLGFDVSIKAVSNTTQQEALGAATVNFNLDEEVKSNTGGQVDGSVVGAMYLNQIAIALDNGDASNNLGNFENVTLLLNTGTATPVVFGPFTVPTGTTNSVVFDVSNSPNIKQYFTGANVNFALLGKAKTATTKALASHVSATLKFDK